MADFTGSGSSETIDGTSEADLIEAGRGADTVNGGAGDDAIFGKKQAVTDGEVDLVASTKDGQADDGNTLAGNEGNDVVVGERRADVLFGDDPEGETGTIVWNGHNDKANQNAYSTDPTDENHLGVTGTKPAFSVEDGAHDASSKVVKDGGEGAGVGNKLISFVESNSRTPTNDFEGGEAMHFDVGGPGTVAEAGTIELMKLDAGDRGVVKVYNGDQHVQTIRFDGSEADAGGRLAISVGGGENDGVVFDKVVVEALPGEGGGNMSSSFSVHEATFTTVATGNDTLVGGGGNDTMYGGHGNDLFIEASAKNGDQSGSDEIYGGHGSDTVDYSDATIRGAGNKAGVVVNLGDKDIDVRTTLPGDEADGNGKIRVDGQWINDDEPGGQTVRAEWDGAAGTAEIQDNGKTLIDKLVDVENVIGTDRQDVMIGSDANNTFKGGERADFLKGMDGNDKLFGDEGDDKLFGGDGNDTVIGGEGSDMLNGDAGNDMLKGREGNDVLHGGDGEDTAVFNDVKGGIQLDLREGQAGPNGYAAAKIDRDGDGIYEETDRIKVSEDDKSGIENVVGSRGNDTIRGNDHDNVLKGGHGNDFLRGDDGDDKLVGGKGNDVIDGGAGVDTYKVGGGVDHKTSDGDGVGGMILDLSAPGTNGYAAARIDRDGDGVFEEVDRIHSPSIENVIGTRGDDQITGNDLDNTIKAGKGNDILDGGKGADRLIGGKGNDILIWDEADFFNGNDEAIVHTKSGGAVTQAEYDEAVDGAKAARKEARSDYMEEADAARWKDLDAADKKAANKHGNDAFNEHLEEAVGGRQVATYDGGQGYDVLVADKDGANIDLAGRAISGIEAVVGGEGAQSVTVDLNEVRRESDDAHASHNKAFDTFTFISGGDDGDVLNLAGKGWSLHSAQFAASNQKQGSSNDVNFLTDNEIGVLNGALGGGASLENGIPAVDGVKLNQFVFEKGNGQFVTVFTDLTLDDIFLNGVDLDPTS